MSVNLTSGSSASTECLAGLASGKAADRGDSSNRRMRVAVVTPIPTPYRDPFWNEFARIPGIDLTVFYCSPGKSDRPWTSTWRREFACEFLPGRNLLQWRSADASCYWNPALSKRLLNGAFDALLIGGYNHLTMWTALRFAVRRKVPFFLMCESHLKSRRSGWKLRLKRPVLSWIVRRAAGFLPTGKLAGEFLLSYGADPRAITVLPNVPDVAAIRTRVEQIRQNGEWPGPAELFTHPLVLFVGRLIPKKRAELLIRAFHCIHRETDAVLAIVGDGPLRPQLEKLAQELGLAGRVHFAGFVEPDEVVQWYARASVFVLPSSETWGVAVLEALASGVPVIVSDEVGCHADVVVDPALGTVVPARSLEPLSRALQAHLAASPARDCRLAAWNAIESRFRYDLLAVSLAHAIAAKVPEHVSAGLRNQ